MSKTDYDLKSLKGVVFDVDGVLSPVVVTMDSNGIPRRMANLRDGYAIQLAVRKGLKVAIITGCNDEAVLHRFNALGVEDIYMITGPKVEVLKNWLDDNGLVADEIAYVGDDIPDYDCMRMVGLPVAPRDAATEIKDVARYITDANGGYGVARELLEQILRAQDKWPGRADANGR